MTETLDFQFKQVLKERKDNKQDKKSTKKTETKADNKKDREKHDKLNDLRFAEERALDLLQSHYGIDLTERHLVRIVDNCAGPVQTSSL